MAVEHLTIVTCDRCKTQKSYAGFEHRDWYSNYAIAWPAEVTPYEEGCVAGHALPGVFVCSSCLTDEEREQLTVARLELQQRHEGLPF